MAPAPLLHPEGGVGLVPQEPMQIATFDNTEDNQPKPADAAWPGDFLDPMELTEREAAPLWSPVTYRPGTRRANVNVQTVHALVLDYDGKTGTPPDPEGVAMQWARLGLEFVLHTSWSSTPAHPRLRVILPYARPATVEEHQATWLWAQQAALPYVIDPARKDACGMYFVPSHPPGVAPVTLHWPGVLLAPLAAGMSTAVAVSGVSPPRSSAVPSSPFAGIAHPEQVRKLPVLEAGCAFLRHARTNAATLPEPEWYAALSLWARCIDGDNVAHVLSSPHPGYTRADTAAKFLRATATGPRTCADIRTMRPDICAGCPANVTSPVLLDAPAIRPEAQLEGARADLKQARKYGTPDAVEVAAERVLALEAAIKAGKHTPRPLPGAHTPTVEQLVLDKEGRPRATKGNIATILTTDPRYDDTFRYDLFASKLYYAGHLAQDHLDTGFALDLERDYGIAVPTPLVSEVVVHTAHQNAYHPVRDYLDTLAHDGEARVGRLLLDGFGCVHTPEQEDFFERMAVKFMVSMVARVREPGCEVHAMMVLTGAQGVGKTRGLSALASKAWFSSTTVEIGSKDSVLQLRGKWLLELAELDSLRKAENTRVKAWVSSPVDNIRPPFGRHTVDIPRETVFAATTNQPRFLTDATGSRRYMVARVEDQVNVGWITEHRSQLWAEAQALYDIGTPWWWTHAEAKELQAFNEEYQERDPWDEIIRAGFGRLHCSTTTASMVLTTILMKEAGSITRYDHERVVAALLFMGCSRDGDNFSVPEALRSGVRVTTSGATVLPFGQHGAN